MKKVKFLLLAGLMVFTMLATTMVTASAAAINITDEFGKSKVDVGVRGLQSEYNVYKADKVRIKYSFGSGYLCPSGGGEIASVIYKFTNPAKLELAVQAHFSSREGYADWTDTPSCTIAVSANEEDWKNVTSWKGKLLDKGEYPSDNDFKDIDWEEYKADLTASVAGMETAYVRLSFDVFDYPMYSSIYSISFSGESGAAKPSATSSNPPAAASSKPQTASTAQTSSKVTASKSVTPGSVGNISSEDMSSEEPFEDISSEDMSSEEPFEDVSSQETPSGMTEGNGDSKTPSWVIVLIIVIVIVCVMGAGGGLLFLLFKKGKI